MGKRLFNDGESIARNPSNSKPEHRSLPEKRSRAQRIKNAKRRCSYDPKAIQITGREIEVLKLVCQELTSQEIGDRLCLSSRTVETYRRTMMEKIGARNSVGLVLYALKMGIVVV